MNDIKLLFFYGRLSQLLGFLLITQISQQHIH